jgi:two-component system, cell cycle sensor histidine kinase and response regulator CckA
VTATAALDARSILIVEDERIVAMDIQQTLNDLGYDAASVASSADEAMACAEARRPELVLMDIRINGPRDGIDAAEALKRIFDVPIVFLTAHADETTLQRAKSTAPHGYLLKPIKAAELRSVVEVSLFRHDMERRQRERDRWFAATLESIADAVLAVGLDGRITFMNPVAEALTGVAASEGVGQPAADVLRLVALQALRLREVVMLPEGQLLNVDTGEQRLIVDSAAPVVDVRSSQMLGAVMVFRDVTERQRMQARLEMIERLASLGTLAAGVAHEVNNPLTVVVANAEYVKGEIEQLRLDAAAGMSTADAADRTRQVAQALDDVSSAAARIGQIVADLKAFARPVPPASGQVDVVRSVEWAIRATAHEFRTRARVVRRLEPVPPVEADDVRLGQVLVNLLTNAAQAIPTGQAGSHEVMVSTGLDAEGRVVITVRDTGGGIPAAVRARIFEPFFTTKRDDGGTGLGLAICHGIVTGLGGDITVESEEGRGTTVRVSLPAAAVAAPEALATAAPAPEAHGARVLVIDDEELLLSVMGRILHDYDVETTADARHALALIEGGRTFDVILVDVTMPLMSGIAFFQELRASYPHLAGRVVFMSGGVFESDFETFLDTVPNVRIGKPFRGTALRQVVQEILDRAASDARVSDR